MVMKRPMVAFLSQLLLAIRSRFTRRARLEAENLLSLPKTSFRMTECDSCALLVARSRLKSLYPYRRLFLRAASGNTTFRPSCDNYGRRTGRSHSSRASTADKRHLWVRFGGAAPKGPRSRDLAAPGELEKRVALAQVVDLDLMFPRATGGRPLSPACRGNNQPASMVCLSPWEPHPRSDNTARSLRCLNLDDGIAHTVPQIVHGGVPLPVVVRVPFADRGAEVEDVRVPFNRPALTMSVQVA
jgi:hypothetical protein